MAFFSDPNIERMLDDADAWGRVRLTGREAAALVRDFRTRGHLTTWALADIAEPHVTRALASTDWATVAGALLIALVEASFALVHGRDHFLPERRRLASKNHRWTLYLHHLWRAAERSGEAPIDLVLAALVRAHAGPLALAEVERRFDQQIGMDAATWLLAACWPPEYGGPLPDDREICQGLPRRLLRSARKRVRGDLRRQAADSELRSAAALTLLRRFGHEHPLEVIARALDGRLNIAPRAIGNELTRHLADGLPPARKRSRQQPEEQVEQEIVIEFRDEADPKMDVEGAVANRERLGKARHVDPATFDAVARAEGRKVDAARALGVSRPTLDKRIRQMVEGLTEK